MNGNVHDFTERLAFSHAAGSDEAAWVRFYQDVWPNAVLIVRVDANSRYQQWGIDRHVYLPSGKVLAIDEKVRDPKRSTYKDGTPYDDMMVEVFSVWKGDGHPDNKLGWTLDARKQCDYVAYAIPLVHRCYLLPFELLRLACVAHLAEWKTLKDAKGYRCYPLDAPNRGYLTRNCAVSWARLFAAMTAEMTRLHGAQGLTLPIPTLQTTQAVFEWVSED